MDIKPYNINMDIKNIKNNLRLILQQKQIKNKNNNTFL